MNHATLWQNILSHLSRSIDAHRFETLFRPLSIHENSDPQVLSLSSPNEYIAEHLEKHFKKILLSAARTFSPAIQDIVFFVRPQSETLQQRGPSIYPKSGSPSLQLNKRFTLDSFVVGPNNQFAHSAAQAVAMAPGSTKFNPLFIYGGVGLGKTHLLQAIGNFALSQNPSIGVLYSTSEEFYLSFIDAIKGNSTKTFSSQFKNADILLIDDVQFFSGKESSQEEFFHIFNSLHKGGKQIVLTADMPPQEIAGLQDRLLSRFQWGLFVDIQPPNLETRVAILNKKADEDNLNIAENILYFIAEKGTSNIRELEGIIIKLLAYASITKSDITIDLVRNVLKENDKNSVSQNVSIEEIIDKTGEYYKIPVNKIREKDRRKEVALCRQVGMFVAKNMTKYSLKTIGLHFGGRDHSTVIHAIKTIEQLKNSDPVLAKDIENIFNSLK
jgi:chromosomal replication initiator protein